MILIGRLRESVEFCNRLEKLLFEFNLRKINEVFYELVFEFFDIVSRLLG